MSTAGQPKHFFKAAIVALFLIAVFIVGLEYYWRSRGYELSYNDDKVLWAMERKKVYEPVGGVTVFCGASRIKWDLDIETWENLTGDKAVQLALVGTSPRKVVLDLANDEKFTGNLVIDVTEAIFFPTDTTRTEVFAREAMEYYHNETPAQEVSGEIGFALESRMVLMEEGKFGLNGLTKDLIKNRPGVVTPQKPFYKEDVITTKRRQNLFTSYFLNTPGYAKANVARWEKRRAMMRGRFVIPKGASIDSLCLIYKAAIDKIQARGGKVIFLRLPSNGPQLASETELVPRQQYWERLLQITNVPGIHFADYPATAGMVCKEASHLGIEDAKKYTSFLAQTLRSEFRWKFPIDKKP
jgi:hypothetical protein